MPRRNHKARRPRRGPLPPEPARPEPTGDQLARRLVSRGLASTLILGRGPGRADTGDDTGDDIEETP